MIEWIVLLSYAVSEQTETTESHFFLLLILSWSFWWISIFLSHHQIGLTIVRILLYFIGILTFLGHIRDPM